MSKERELLLRVLLQEDVLMSSGLFDEIEQLLAQPESITPQQRIPFYKQGYKRGYTVAVMDLKKKVDSVFNAIMEDDNRTIR